MGQYNGLQSHLKKNPLIDVQRNLWIWWMSTVYKDTAKMQKVSLTFAVFMCFVLLDFKNDFFNNIKVDIIFTRCSFHADASKALCGNYVK